VEVAFGVCRCVGWEVNANQADRNALVHPPGNGHSKSMFCSPRMEGAPMDAVLSMSSANASVEASLPLRVPFSISVFAIHPKLRAN
jgi:hypothetical protein